MANSLQNLNLHYFIIFVHLQSYNTILFKVKPGILHYTIRISAKL